MIAMIKITDLSGIAHNINLDYVVQVDLPSGANLNELILLSDGRSIRLLAGSWEASLVAFFAAFNGTPAPVDNPLDQVYIDLT